MKKVFYSLLAVAGMLLAVNNAQAQQPALKIGIFDIDKMVTALPGYGRVDSLLQTYQSDSLAAEYDFYQSEYKRLDSTYKLDSAGKKAQTVLDMEKQQRQQVAINLVYWQQIAQQKLENKRGQLAQPLYEQVVNAYKKILDTKKYTLILKPEAVEQGTNPALVDNIFELVAKELKIPLQGAATDQDTAPGGSRTQPQTKPPVKAPAGTAKPKG